MNHFIIARNSLYDNNVKILEKQNILNDIPDDAITISVVSKHKCMRYLLSKQNADSFYLNHIDKKNCILD